MNPHLPDSYSYLYSNPISKTNMKNRISFFRIKLTPKSYVISLIDINKTCSCVCV